MTASASVVDWQDRAEGLEADLRSAVQVAYKRGAREWARLNYPDWIEWLESCEPHPAEQDAREAVASIISRELCRIAARPRASAKSFDDDGRDIAAALTQAAPDGWRLVPVEPDEAMLAAVRPLNGRRIWPAMLSASPAPPAQGAG